MPVRTQNLRIVATRPLVAPGRLQEQLPLPGVGADMVAETRREIARIIAGRDDRLIVVVGPCSIHDPDAALEYARRLRPLATRLRADLRIVMRAYFEKPRTIVGWKGLINDPGLDGSFRINDGLRIARRLLLDVVAAGLPAATEFLDTTIGQYFADSISWGCIGARTVESQIHRELASGLSMPVGFKNRTDGDVSVAVDAMRAAAHPHWFPSLTSDGTPAVLGTRGNKATHLILRGGSSVGPNFAASHVAEASRRMRTSGIRPSVMIDCSHANSGKDPAQQPAVATDVAKQISGGERAIIGAMLESNLVGGRQEYKAGQPLVRGQSITDGCLGWDQTVLVLKELAKSVRARRAAYPKRQTK